MYILERSGGEIRKGNDTIIKFKGPLPTPPALYFCFPTCHPSVALTMNHSGSCMYHFNFLPLHPASWCLLCPECPCCPYLYLFNSYSACKTHLIWFSSRRILVWGRGIPPSSMLPVPEFLILSTDCMHCSCPSPPLDWGHLEDRTMSHPSVFPGFRDSIRSEVTLGRLAEAAAILLKTLSELHPCQTPGVICTAGPWLVPMGVPTSSHGSVSLPEGTYRPS